MAARAIQLIKDNPKTSFFFAFGVGHFRASSQWSSILDIVREAGFQVRHVSSGKETWRDENVNVNVIVIHALKIVENMKTEVKYTLGQSKNKKLFYSTLKQEVVYVM